MPRHTVSYAPGRALLGAPYPLPNIISKPSRRPLPSPSLPPQLQQTEQSNIDTTLIAANSLGLPYDPNWRSRPPACPPVPYPPKSAEEIAEIKRCKAIRKEIRRMRKSIGSAAGWEVPQYDDMEGVEAVSEGNVASGSGSQSNLGEMDQFIAQSLGHSASQAIEHRDLDEPELMELSEQESSDSVEHDYPDLNRVESNGSTGTSSSTASYAATSTPQVTLQTASSQPRPFSPPKYHSQPIPHTPARGRSVHSTEEDQVDGGVSPANADEQYTDLITPHQHKSSSTSPSTSVSLADMLLEQLWSDEERDVMTTLDAMSSSHLSSTSSLRRNSSTSRHSRVIRIPRSRPSRLRSRLESLPKGLHIPTISRTSSPAQHDDLLLTSESSANAIRNMDIEAFRRSVRFDKTTVIVASDRLRASLTIDHSNGGEERGSGGVADMDLPHGVEVSNSVEEKAYGEEEVDEPLYSAMSIDPKTGESRRASWPHELPARETGQTVEPKMETPTPAAMPTVLQETTVRTQPIEDTPCSSQQPPQVYLPIAQPNPQHPSQQPQPSQAPQPPPGLYRYTLLQPFPPLHHQQPSNGVITPLRPIFRQLHIPPPPSPFSMGVVVRYKSSPTISPLSRGLVIPSAPPSRPVHMPQLKACQNFLLAKRCQVNQRKSTRDHNLALFVLAQQSNKKLVILNDQPPPPMIQRVMYRARVPGGIVGMPGGFSQQAAQGGPGAPSGQAGSGVPIFGGWNGNVNEIYPKPIPTFFQPGQALFKMNAVGSYVQPIPNPFFGNQPHLPPQQSDANFFLRAIHQTSQTAQGPQISQTAQTAQTMGESVSGPATSVSSTPLNPPAIARTEPSTPPRSIHNESELEFMTPAYTTIATPSSPGPSTLKIDSESNKRKRGVSVEDAEDPESPFRGLAGSGASVLGSKRKRNGYSQGI